MLKLTILASMLLSTSFVTKGSCTEGESTDNLRNNTHPDKDLYVIHATVYQVGILTNRTDNVTDGFNSANQESVTLYHTNGSNIDLSGIPEPLLTNVTAQSIVGVAPVPDHQNMTPNWGYLRTLTQPDQLANDISAPETNKNSSADHSTTKLSTNSFLLRLFKRNTNGDNPVKMVDGTALITPETGVQSIALPPLLELNNNLSNIPVPIPNTSVVHYAKVNTLIRKP